MTACWAKAETGQVTGGQSKRHEKEPLYIELSQGPRADNGTVIQSHPLPSGGGTKGTVTQPPLKLKPRDFMSAAYTAAARFAAACMDRPGLPPRHAGTGGGQAAGRHGWPRRHHQLSSMQESSYPPSSLPPSFLRPSFAGRACLLSSSVAEVQRAAGGRSADRRGSYLRSRRWRRTRMTPPPLAVRRGRSGGRTYLVPPSIYFEGGMSGQSGGRRGDGRPVEGGRGRRPPYSKTKTNSRRGKSARQ